MQTRMPICGCGYADVGADAQGGREMRVRMRRRSLLDADADAGVDADVDADVGVGVNAGRRTCHSIRNAGGRMRVAVAVLR